MNRRRVLGISAAVTSALLGPASLSFARRNFGIGVARATNGPEIPARTDSLFGRVAAVDGATVRIDVGTRRQPDHVRLHVVRREYPAGAVLGERETDRISIPETGQATTVDVAVDDTSSRRGSGPWFYEVYASVLESSHSPAGPFYLCESGPYRWADETETVAESAPRIRSALGSTSRESFVRRQDDNDYVLDYRWLDSRDDCWAVRYRLRRSVHEAAIDRERGYVQTFEESIASPLARDFAATVTTDATRHPTRGTTSETSTESLPRDSISLDRIGDENEGETSASPRSLGERFEHLVGFVQGLDYARDAESIGVYEYNRTVEETLADGVGDCKDKSYLLAGLLAAPPLECTTALLFQPAHVLLGVAAADVPAPFDDVETLTFDGREYLPVDPSLRFEIGCYPDAPVTAVYGDSKWLYYDAEAIGRGLDRNVRDWLQYGSDRHTS